MPLRRIIENEMSAKTGLVGGGSSGSIQATPLELDQGGELGSQEKRIDGDGGAGGALFRSDDRRQGTVEIGATELGRPKKKSGEISIFGASIPRIAPPIETPNALENKVADLLGGLFANKGPLADPKIKDYRDVASVRAAISAPLDGPVNAFGPLTIYRPGLGNTAPGPAQIARMAMYTDKLIIAYANPGKGEDAKLRPVTEIDGVPLPPELIGKVFAIGSPKNLMISWEQASDAFLEQLESMKNSKYLQGIDLMNAKATVLAHSQGGRDAVETRARLEEAGFVNTIGALGTMNTPFWGSPVSDETMAGILTEGGERLAHLQSMGAINALDPDYMKARPRDPRLVDVSLVGQTEAGAAGRSDIRRFFKFSEKAIELSKSFASLFKGADARKNDGLVTVESQKFGRDQVILEKSYDHAGIAEDPSVADVLARHIAAARSAAR